MLGREALRIDPLPSVAAHEESKTHLDVMDRLTPRAAEAFRLSANRDPQYLKKVSGLPYDVEAPSVSRGDGVDSYVLRTQIAGMRHLDPARRALIQALMPLAAPDIQVDGFLLIPNGANTFTGTRVRLGDCVHLDDNGWVELGEGVTIGARSSLITIEHPFDPLSRIGNYVRVKPIRIGNEVRIGERCTILPGVTIGSNVRVLSGSVVNRDVPDGVVVSGKPAKECDYHACDLSGSTMQANPYGTTSRGREYLWRFNLDPFHDGLFAAALPFLRKNIPAMEEFATCVFPPFWCEDGRNFRFRGPCIFMNTGGVYHDGDPAKPIVISQGTFFGPNVEVCGGTVFGDACWIGANSVIGEGATLGKGVIVAAGSVVPPGECVSDFMIVAGDPLRVIRPIDPVCDAWPLDADATEAMARRLAKRGINIERLRTCLR